MLKGHLIAFYKVVYLGGFKVVVVGGVRCALLYVGIVDEATGIFFGVI